MTNLRTLTITFACTALVALAGSAQAQDKAKAPAAKKDPQAAMMEAMQKAAAVGPEHASLKGMAGDWTAITKFWMAPGTEAKESAGKSHQEMVLGDHFLHQSFDGEAMGQPFKGSGLTGYDNVKKKYVSVWADSMGSMIMYSEGKADASGKVITMESTNPDVLTGKPKKTKTIVRIESDSKYTFEMYDRDAKGKEFKQLEITYNKAAAAAAPVAAPAAPAKAPSK